MTADDTPRRRPTRRSSLTADDTPRRADRNGDPFPLLDEVASLDELTAVRRSGNIHPLPDPDPEGLPAFDGLAVTRATVRITKAGDGLSEALAVQPEAFHGSQEVFFVLRGVVKQVNHKFGDQIDDPITRVHTIDTTGITKIDRKLAEKLLNEAAERLAQAKAKADGDVSMFDVAPEEAD